MNLEQILNEINKDIDDTLDNADLIGWVNRAIDDLTPYANYQKNAVIEVVPGQKEYDLPEDFLKVFQLVDGDQVLYNVPVKEFRIPGFKLWGNKLTLQPAPDKEKELDLYYLAKLPHLNEMDDEPAFASHFHDLLVMYAVGKAKYQDEEESMQMNVISDYQHRKDDFIRYHRIAETEQIRDVYGI